MSGLAALLAHRRLAGVYRWHETSVDVAHACERAGWRYVAVSTWDAHSRADLFDSLSAALPLPEYFGRNWDALADCLSDLSPKTLIEWTGWGDCARHGFLDTALEIFAESGISVLLADPGPALSYLPSLD